MNAIRQLAKTFSRCFSSESLNSKHLSLAVEPLESRQMLSTVDIYAAGATGHEQLQLLIDNQAVATWSQIQGNVNDRQLEKLRYESEQVLSADQVSIRFLNDAYDAITGYDRNLLVDKIVIDSRVFQTESQATHVSAYWNDGIQSGNLSVETLNVDGQFNFSDNGVQTFDRLVVTAFGSTGDERMRLKVNGEIAGEAWVSQQALAYEFIWGRGARSEEIQIEFINDDYNASQGYDRNLTVLALDLVDSDTLASRSFSTAQVNLFSTGTWTPEDGIQPGYNRGNTLNANGYMQFGFGEDRQIDGVQNNVSEGQYNSGSAGSIIPRFADHHPEYGGDGLGNDMVDARPNPRDISNLVVQSDQLVANSGDLSDMVWLWGQFLDHDLSLSKTEHGAVANGSAPILLNDPSDPLGPRPMGFTRSDYATDELGYRQQVNAITSFIDASNVYGSDYQRAAALRTFSGGKLKTGVNSLLPTGIDISNEDGGLGATNLFVAGDVRANENVALASMHTIFVREHNRLAEIISQQRPADSDESIYQLTRKIVGAQMQIITYNEFLPALLGESAPAADQYQYSSTVNPAIVNSFAHAAYRFGHSMLGPSLQLAGPEGQIEGAIALKDAFFNPEFLHENAGRLDQLLQGMMGQRAQEIDIHMVDDVRNFLFGPPGAGGLDLASLNTQRGRDHGIPGYNRLREIYGLGRVDSFAQITSDSELRSRLASIYRDVDQIDAWVGGLAEDHVAGANVGELLQTIIGSQFERLRDGDRLFYTSDDLGLYEHGQLREEIRSIIDLDHFSLATVLAANSNVVPSDNPFFVQPGTSLAIHAYSTVPGGVFVVRVGGEQMVTFQTTTIGNRFLINVPQLDPGWLDIEIEFVNDEYVAGELDRNLLINSIQFGSSVFETDSESVFSTGTWRAEDGVVAGFGRGNVLHADGFFRFTVWNELELPTV